MNIRRLLLLILCTLSLVIGLPAVAAPWNNGPDRGYQKNGHHKGKHSKKHNKKHKRKYLQEVVYEDEHGGPPPWAPAHGYRNKHSHDERTEVIVVNAPSHQQDRYAQHDSVHMDFEVASQKIGISAGTCDRETMGAVLGGIAGGIIGNKTASSDKKTIGTLAGVVLGVVIGKELNHSMDKTDAQCTGQALERARDGQAVVWNNPDNGHQYSVTPYKSYQQDDGRYCRKYNATVKDDGKAQQYQETACRNQDGLWERQF